MCLAIPGKVLETHLDHEMRMAKVEFGGIIKRICLEYVPEAKIGDYVLVHVGFALAIVAKRKRSGATRCSNQWAGSKN